MIIQLQTSLAGHVRKCAVPVVSIQNIPTEIAHVNIREAIVVVIADADTEGVGSTPDACLLGHVREFHPTVISIESISRSGGAGTRERLSTQEVDVDLAIPVIVEKSQAAGDGLH